MGHTDVINLLAEKGADLNFTNQQQETPLHLAVRTNQNEAIKCLLDHRCDVNTPTMVGIFSISIAYNNDSENVSSDGGSKDVGADSGGR